MNMNLKMKAMGMPEASLKSKEMLATSDNDGRHLKQWVA